ncbi:MAG: hypothetical protein J5497_08135 [Selenomonadaceae bacterium]|nr:hypothetical protein [Selenomonadaceae bacterium]
MMKIKGVLKKKYPPNVGRLNKKPANRLEILKYVKEKERDQYEKEIRSAKSLFDGIV